MIQLILHGIGDYYLQTDYQELHKKDKGLNGIWCCFKHCFTYSLLFLIYHFVNPDTISLMAVLWIFITHFIIDRTNLVAYMIAIKNGTMTDFGEDYMYTNWKYDISNFGFGKERPFAITIWLYIICDNILHIICNYLAIKYL